MTPLSQDNVWVPPYIFYVKNFFDSLVNAGIYVLHQCVLFASHVTTFSFQVWYSLAYEGPSKNVLQFVIVQNGNDNTCLIEILHGLNKFAIC